MAAKTPETLRKSSFLSRLRCAVSDTSLWLTVTGVRQVPPLRGFFRRLNEEANNGLPDTARAFFTMRRAQFPAIWEGDQQETKEILAHSPVVVVHNHGYNTEPFVVLANMLSRLDVKTIVNGGFIPKLTPNNSRRHLISVMPHGLIETKAQTKRRQDANKQTMDRAAAHVEKGGALVLAPDGGLQGHWRPGVAQIIEGVERPDAYFVMAHVAGNRAMVKELLRGKGFHRHVTFSKAYTLPQLMSKLNIPVEILALPQGDKKKLSVITARLEAFYDNWASKLLHSNQNS